MFTSLSANVGFNPFLAGELVCRSSACCRRTNTELGHLGHNSGGRGGVLPGPREIWLVENGNGCL